MGDIFFVFRNISNVKDSTNIPHGHLVPIYNLLAVPAVRHGYYF